jgi:NDP-sugar pyrophosphorylase family protein
MQCAILAGGLATRLRPLTDAVPKALIPVAGRPFADHQLARLSDEGFDDVVYCIGHLGDQVRDFVGDGDRWRLRVRYVDEGGRLLGTAGALRLAHREGALEPTFGVIYGDSYLLAPLHQAWDAFGARGLAPALMTVYRNEGRFDASNVQLEGGMVVRYEKGLDDPTAAGMHHIDYGFSVLDRDAVIAPLPEELVVDLADVLGRLSAAGRLAGHEVTERVYEVGSPAGLAELDAMLRRPSANLSGS